MKLGISSRSTRAVAFIAVCVLIIGLSSCAYQPPAVGYDDPGFLAGLVHGFLIFFSFIGSLFTDFRIYAFPNDGGWYDFGYLIGASLFLGGGGASAT